MAAGAQRRAVRGRGAGERGVQPLVGEQHGGTHAGAHAHFDALADGHAATEPHTLGKDTHLPTQISEPRPTPLPTRGFVVRGPYVRGRIELPLLGNGSGELVRVCVGRNWWSVRGAGGSNRVDEGGKCRQPRG